MTVSASDACLDPGDARIEARFNSLRTTALLVCEFMAKSSNISNEGFSLDEEKLCVCVRNYFSHVDHFKTENGFDRDDLINKSKQAALMVPELLKIKPILVAENVPDTIHTHSANSVFALRVALVMLRVDMLDVPDRVQDDVLYVLRNDHHLEPKLLILAMLLIEEAYGPKAQCPPWHARLKCVLGLK